MPAGGDEQEQVDAEKKSAAEAAADLVSDGMTVGLGTGTTVAYLLPALAARHLDIRCVATSLETASSARRLGLDVLEFSGVKRLDIAIDGADEVDPQKWLIKGGGGAHTREKIVAAAAERFVVIVSSNKLVRRLTPPIPLELLSFGLDATLAALDARGSVQVRPSTPPSPDGGIIADWLTDFDDPTELSELLAALPGVVEHGLFPPHMVSEIVVGAGQAAGA